MNKLLKYSISLIIFALIIYIASPQELLKTFLNISLEAIVLLLLISIVLIYISALKWKIFIEYFGCKTSVFHLFNLYVIGYFVNLLLPSHIGGDLTRSYFLGKKIGQSNALSATILERYTGLLAMLSLSLIFIKKVNSQIQLIIIAIALLLFITTILALYFNLELLSKFTFIRPILPFCKKVQQGFRLAKKSPVLLLKTFALSILFHIFTVINVIIAGYAIGWNCFSCFYQLFVILPIILLISALPILPNGLGIQEGAYFYFLKTLGASGAESVSISLILRAKAYLIAIIGYFIWLKERKK